MTHAQLDALLALIGGHNRSPSLQALRLVLTGTAQADAAREVGISASALGNIVRRARIVAVSVEALQGVVLPEVLKKSDGQ